MADKFVFYYVPIDNITNAKEVAKDLVKRKLAGCVNVIDGMTSVYEWQGKIEEGNECIMIIKSLEVTSKKLEKAIKALHPYKIPCIAKLKLSGLNDGFGAWLKKSLLK